MSLQELQNFFESAYRVQEARMKEQAFFDYVLGDLVGRSMARVYGANNQYPKIYDAYPSLYNKEEMERKDMERRTELSALRLQEFLKSFNDNKNKKKEVELN